MTGLLTLIMCAPLSLGQVLESLDEHPQMEAAEAKIHEAEAKLLKAEGAFDTYASLKAKAYPTGKNQREMLGVFLEQPTPYWGARLSAGWQRGVGEVPPYEGQLATVDSGEVALKVQVPLLQGRATDPARVALERGRLWDAQGTAAQREKRRQLSIKAATAFWSWVAAGHVAKAHDELLDAANLRFERVQARAAVGDIKEVSVLEARRAVLKRKAQRIKAYRSVDKAAIKLALYLRQDGRPSAPTLDRLPPLPEPGQLDAATPDRPAIDILRAQSRRARLDERLGENSRLPRLDLEALAVQPLGDEPSEWAAGLSLSVPLQRRKADGETAKASATARRLDADARWLEEQVAAAAADALSAARAARLQVDAARAAAEVAEAVVKAQRARVELGDTEMLTLNLREQAATQARVTWIEAKAEWQIAAAKLRFVGPSD